jgi:capsular polysaccharide biosynthesis protein
MTQLDLPPISLARYFDLLRRRRWQVIPISLLGMVGGALFAFLVPRYYVVHTTIHFEDKIVRSGRADRDDKTEVLQGEYERARLTIPGTVPDVLRKLRWPEALAAGDEERRAFEIAVRRRVTVEDLNVSKNRRSYVDLRIGYRDTDGPRAVEFVHALRDHWLEDEQKRLLERLEVERRALNDELAARNQALDTLQVNLRQFEIERELNPQDFAGGPDRLESVLSADLRRHSDKLIELRAEGARIDAKLVRTRDQLQATPPRIRRLQGGTLDPELEAQLSQARGILLLIEQKFLWMKDAHPEKRQTERLLSVLRARYAQLEQIARERRSEEIDNPAQATLKEEVTKLADELADNAGLRAAQEALVQRLQARLAAMPSTMAEYRKRITAVESAQKDVAAVEVNRREAEAWMAELTRARPYRVLESASLPPRPTDPNITLVAAGGSIVGLAAAIALILLLDFVRSTFKTVDDVARGLPVPVLGGFSYLETAEERGAVRARRRRISLLVFAFVVLLAAVVTVYYVAPARLPPPVFAVLELLLGGTR